jgi:protein TonB
MFEQSQLGLNVVNHRKPASMIVGFILQALGAAGAVLISLLFTEAVPRTKYATFLMSPPSGNQRPVEIVQSKPRAVPVKFKPRACAFCAPAQVPEHAAILVEQQRSEPPADLDTNAVFMGVEGGIDGNSSAFLASSFMRNDPVPPPPPVVKSADRTPDPVRVSSSVALAKLVHRVQPLYPKMALMARIQGSVNLEAVIDEQGNIANLRVVSGHPLLIQAAVDAVSEWRYEPTQLNGLPVAVITTVEVNFKIGG